MTEKRGVGRPKNKTPPEFTTVRISAELAEKARAIGGGNASKGVAIALSLQADAAALAANVAAIKKMVADYSQRLARINALIP